MKDRILLAFGWMALSAAGFGTLNFLVKLLTESLDPTTVVFLRVAINFVLVCLVVRIKRLPWKIKDPRDLRKVLSRGVSGVIVIACNFYAIKHLPLSIAPLLGNMAPVFVVIYSRIFLNEKMDLPSLGLILATIGGLALTLGIAEEGATLMRLEQRAVIIAILGAAFAGFSYTLVRSVTQRVPNHVIVMYFTGVATVVSAVFVDFSTLKLDTRQWVLAIGIGLAAGLGQFSMTEAMKHAKAGLVATLGLMTPAFSLILGVMIFSENLPFQKEIGIFCIFLSIAALCLREYMREIKNERSARQINPA